MTPKSARKILRKYNKQMSKDAPKWLLKLWKKCTVEAVKD